MAIRTLSLSTPVAAPPAASVFYGQHDPDLAAYAGPTGVAGDAGFTTQTWGTNLAPTGSGTWVHVSTSGSDSTGDGSSGNPYRTIGYAAHPDRYVAGSTILVAPGLYAESPRLGESFPSYTGVTATDRIKIARKGTGRVVVHGGDLVSAQPNLVSGFTACVDQADAGGNPNWANMERARITASDLAIPIDDLQLAEEYVPGYVAVDGPGFDTTEKMFAQGYYRWFYQEENGDFTWAQSGSDLIITHTHLQSFADGSLVGRTASLHQSISGNQSDGQYEITAHDATAGTITIAGFFQPSYTFNGRYAMLGDPLFISAAGQWAYNDNGDGTYELWYWPRSDSSKVRMSQRHYGFGLRNAFVTIYGIDVVGVGGDGNGSYEKGAFGRLVSPTIDVDDVILEECHALGTSVVGNYNVAMDIGKGTGRRILNCTTDLSRGQGISVEQADDIWIRNCYIRRCGWTAYNIKNTKNCIGIFNKIIEVFSSHGNGCTIYFGGENILFAFNQLYTWVDGEEVGAIPFAHRGNNGVYFIRNLVGCAAYAAGRGIENNGSTGPNDFPGDWTSNSPLAPILHLGNTIVPWKNAANTPADGYGLVANTQVDTTQHVIGNVLYGWTEYAIRGTKGDYDHNAVVPYDGSLPTGSTNSAVGNTSTDANSLFADYTTGDYSPVGDALTAIPDKSSYLPLESWVPGYDATPANMTDVAALLRDGVDINGASWPWTRRGAIAP